MNCPSCQQVLQDSVYFCGNCGAPATSDDAPTARLSPQTQSNEPRETAGNGRKQLDPLVGRVLDSKYELVERLGEGGMGAVYRARRLHIGDEVAVKLLHTNLVVRKEALERFRREARSAAMISHPNVVSIHDFNDASASGGEAYIVMELVKGTSLRTLLEREGRMSPERAVALMRDICAGVGIAHRQGLLHRDLKPDNVIITPVTAEGEPETAKVVDFGLAKLREVTSGANLTETGAVIGTLYYMSPEQCSGEEVDARADVYSLGAMLFEMLTGEPPFRANNFTGLIAKHLHEPPPPLPAGLNIPPALAAVCARALSKAPHERQPDASAFSREVQAAMLAPTGFQPTAASVQAMHPSQATPRVPQQQRATSWLKWAIVATGVLLLGMVLIGVGIAIKFRGVTFGGNNAGESTNSRNQNQNAAKQNGDTSAVSEADSNGSATGRSTNDLRGRWTGTYGPLGLAATLIINNQKGEKFDGVLEQGEVRVSFNGTVNVDTRQITMKQSKVLNGAPGSWSLGEDAGTVSPNGKQISGKGKDAVGDAFGMSYEWTFLRK